MDHIFQVGIQGELTSFASSVICTALQMLPWPLSLHFFGLCFQPSSQILCSRLVCLCHSHGAHTEQFGNICGIIGGKLAEENVEAETPKSNIMAAQRSNLGQCDKLQERDGTWHNKAQRKGNQITNRELLDLHSAQSRCILATCLSNKSGPGGTSAFHY